MAPRTRRSTGAADALAAARALDELEAAEQLQRESAQNLTASSKRRPGRPRKNQAPIPIAGSSDSASSAPTPLTNASDGEYSTPATSNAVTPAPPTKTTLDIPASIPKSSNRPRRGRLTLELPELPPDDDGEDINDGGLDKITVKPLRSSTTGRPRRKQGSVVKYNEDSDEYSDFYGKDTSRDAVLARRLQREEDQKASTTSLSVPVKRGAREPSWPASDTESDTATARRPRKRQKTSTAGPTVGQGSDLSTPVEIDVEDQGSDFLSDYDSVGGFSDSSGPPADEDAAQDEGIAQNAGAAQNAHADATQNIIPPTSFIHTSS
ncbi:hypothetical protein GQX73_g6818 [Xylaria multiplex]|uniref:Uncharacterized protein n=1 Tax=Xylaria multiplex TaxID=323545 RepID=A0A7C8IPB8_9PEZI|nr:hypothetical protein GQX73_g6818 [Xylaria multiplex]